ncbi:MAG TPA: glutamate--cysteine ligase [Gaiellaceae bacterium]|jgi:carboxylate-amine ligase|nr:glutamate--cysteine ligase [Gaiellaceae bacterium]
MEVMFGRSAPFTIGIEEEFQLLSPESYELVSRFDEVAEAAGDERIKPELLRSVLEVATSIGRNVEETLDEARQLRARLRAAAAERGTLIASAGTHPFSRYEHQEVTDEPRYAGLMEKMQWTAERQVIFGLHVHVGLQSADQAISVANALRTWLPELLALSANSPFWGGRDTGLASTRTKVFDTFPRSGLPPAFSSFDEFELLVERAVKTNSFPDYTYIWWDLRPHPRLGTIEVRVCDAQTRIESVSAIVALVQSLVATLAERHEREGALPIQPVTLVAENKWRAARYGLDADLIWLERDEERPAREALRQLVELAEPAARRLGCALQLGDVEEILRTGTGADEQRRVYAETKSLLGVAEFVAATTVEGV